MNLVSSVTAEGYNEAMNNGKQAEMEVFGPLRGGWFFEGSFYYTTGMSRMVCKSASSFPLSGVKVF